MEHRIKCPTCKKPAIYSKENPYRPFCSERCRLIDLGEWVDGKYGIPCEDSLDDETEKIEG